ncbi:YhjD/YihY/BrkB family envelope integrity protein [Microbacterium paulum]|uniref:YhjD/YihY/BrkB family envelope integrity protein n=1 Tax=Microbacterium paulum TaxID=2707006 RepID=UPI0018C2FA70
MSEHPSSARAAADSARAEEEGLRERWESTQASLRERFDAPLNAATEITRKTLALFPVRVWRHFLQHNGFLLAAGVSYQALFSFFAVIYVAFAGVGLWLGGSPAAVQGLIAIIDSYIPGLIRPEGQGGVFTTEQVTEIATGSTGVLAVTGVVAVLTAIWTSIGFVTFTRRAVRDIFGLPFDDRSYVLLKARDFVAALLFGIALVLGSAVSFAGTWALGWIFSLLGWSTASGWYRLGLGLVSILVSVAVFTGALALLFRFLTGTSLTWRRIRPGGLFGGIALTVLQLGAGWVLRYTPSNPLLATFTIFIGLLLWFRVIGIIILVSASWIAVAASDEDEPLAYLSDADRLREEHAALLLAAQVRLRTARDDRADAPWYRRFAATRAVREAEAELAEVEAAAPAPASRWHTDLFG